MAFLRQRVEGYMFQDMTVVESVEDLFADYAEAGSLAPAWRWELADRERYARRSLTTQYQESDHAFLQRLLAEEGIYGGFEHDADPESDTFGSHTLVLADHGDAFADAGAMRYSVEQSLEVDANVPKRALPMRGSGGFDVGIRNFLGRLLGDGKQFVHVDDFGMELVYRPDRLQLPALETMLRFPVARR
ncbi:contractile injection system protein, VgrG/Pvc8 family [Luteimonas endophytica]|uniref:contractile injection system protein, VgrG/Pvc8 family n=1 Tax=Luteimonas endophytica TaxID=3042023 RepID=UPI003CE5A88E